MPLGSRHTLTGIILANGSRDVLQTDDGGLWQLEEMPRGYLGRRVTVTVERVAFNAYVVESVDAA